MIHSTVLKRPIRNNIDFSLSDENHSRDQAFLMWDTFRIRRPDTGPALHRVFDNGELAQIGKDRARAMEEMA